MKTSGQEKEKSLYGGDADDGAECPICLEKLPPHAPWNGSDKGERAGMACCGNFLCSECNSERHRKTKEIRARINTPDQDSATLNSLTSQLQTLLKCPLCREEFTKNPFDLALRRAMAGNKNAQYDVAMLYESGNHVKVDLSKALHWYTKAAAQGAIGAMSKCAEFFEDGKGCKKSETEAFHWMKKAADAGFPPAKYNLCRYYNEGIGTKVDKEKAIELLKESADGGFGEAQLTLGKFYMLGEGREKNMKKALPLLKAVGEKDNPEAQFLLSQWYLEDRDFDRSMEWLQKSADSDFSDALCFLGNILHSTGTCDVHAIKKFRRAAALGDKDAARIIVEMEEKYFSECSQCHKKKTKTANLLKCSKCKLMHYCSKECQKLHWKATHKKECSLERCRISSCSSNKFEVYSCP